MNNHELDFPLHKETICSEIFGRFIAIAEMAGLRKGVEFETVVKPVLQCSTKILWLDRVSDRLQATVVVKSLDMSVEYGVVDKTTKQVLYREKLGAIIHSFNVWFQKLRADCPLPHQGGAA